MKRGQNKIRIRALLVRSLYSLTWALFLSFSLALNATAQEQQAERIVSFDLCVDQLLLDIVPIKNIAAVTFLTRDENYSFHAKKVKKVGITNGSIEDAFKFKADLVLVGAFESRSKINLLRRLGFRVEVIPFALDSELLKNSISKIGKVTGRETRAAEIISEFDAEIEHLANNRPVNTTTYMPRAIHLAARRHTQGAKSVVNTLFDLAGYKNMALETGQAGGGYIGLETLVNGRPDLLVVSKADGEGYSMATAALSHPALDQLIKQTRLTEIHQKYLLCLTTNITQAAELLQKQQEEVRP